MKIKIKNLYFIIPLIYVLVIPLLFLFHFLGKDPLKSDAIGYLMMSGTKSRPSIFSKQKILDLYAQFGGFSVQFSGASSPFLEFDGGKSETCEIDTYTIFEKNVEIRYTNGLVLTINVSGDLGAQAIVALKKLPAYGKAITLVIPFHTTGSDLEIPEGIPVLACKASFEQFFLTLPNHSHINVDKKLLVIEDIKNQSPIITLERGEKEYQNPYLYWYLNKTYPVTQKEYEERINQYVFVSYNNWIYGRYNNDRGLWQSKNSIELFDENIVKAMLAESVRMEYNLSASSQRNVYKKTTSMAATAIERKKKEDLGTVLPFLSSPFLGNLENVVRKLQEEDQRLLKKAEGLILEGNSGIFEVPHLILFLIDRGNISRLDELVSRIVNNVDPDKVTIPICLGMTDVYADVVKWLNTKEQYFQKYKDLIITHILPKIIQLHQGLFLQDNEKKKVFVFQSVRAGYILIKTGNITDNPDLVKLGQKLIFSALSLSNEYGYLPEEIILHPHGEYNSDTMILPEEIYDFILPDEFIPREIPIHPEIRPGTWIWTAAKDIRVQNTGTELHITFSYPEGFTHYFFIQGLQPFSALLLHGENSEENSGYSRAQSGWYYSESIQTLYVKLTHKTGEEDVVIEY